MSYRGTRTCCEAHNINATLKQLAIRARQEIGEDTHHKVRKHRIQIDISPSNIFYAASQFNDLFNARDMLVPIAADRKLKLNFKNQRVPQIITNTRSCTSAKVNIKMQVMTISLVCVSGDARS